MKKRAPSVMSAFFLVVIVLAIAFATIGCTQNQFVEIPAGFVGRVLTPTGFTGEFLPAGQVDIGIIEPNTGKQNFLILLEITSVTIKEQFLGKQANKDGEDHRVTTRDMVPISVDIRLKAMVPNDNKVWNDIVAQVTATQYTNNPRVKAVRVQDIYERFPAMDVRGKVREIIGPYENYIELLRAQGMGADGKSPLNEKFKAAFIKAFNDNKTPLTLQNVELSNIKADEEIWAQENRKAAMVSIKMQITEIGDTLRDHPEYLQYLKYQTMKDVAAIGSQTGTNTIIISDMNSGSGVSSGDAAVIAYMEKLLKERAVNKLTTPPAPPTPAPATTPQQKK
ncbi:MAG: hypothetical protein Q7R84_02860 [bacterium]|nr:hypothetical protein [bacterium]